MTTQEQVQDRQFSEIDVNHPIYQAFCMLASRIADHEDYGECYNYEKEIQEDNKNLDHLLAISADDFIVNAFSEKPNAMVEFKYGILPFAKIGSEGEAHCQKIAKDHDLTQGYILCLGLLVENLPEHLKEGLANTTGVGQFFCYIPFSKLTPTRLSPEQIRKRLNRMRQSQGNDILILDPMHPDYMGENMEMWLVELSALRANNQFVLYAIKINQADREKYLPLILKYKCVAMLEVCGDEDDSETEVTEE
jgi:hypothetical protein